MSQSASKIMDGELNEDGEKAVDTISFDDAVLVERCRKGDMQAFGSLVAKYQDRIFNLILRMCQSKADAEELAQETFLKALEKIGQFRGQSRFYTWLFRIAVNLVISHRRRGGRIKFQSLAVSEDFGQTQAEGLAAAMAQKRNPGPVAAAMTAENVRRIMAAIEQLDEDFRCVVVLRDIENMSYNEISQVVAIPVGTVKSRLARARNMLKEKLSDLVG